MKITATPISSVTMGNTLRFDLPDLCRAFSAFDDCDCDTQKNMDGTQQLAGNVLSKSETVRTQSLAFPNAHGIAPLLGTLPAVRRLSDSLLI